MRRLFVIGWAVSALLAYAAWARLSHRARAKVPMRLRRTLERLGPPFIKLGQALSLRRDLLPDDITAELQRLQDAVEPFSTTLARKEIEGSLGKPLTEIFGSFEDTPFAAASIAQVHRARLPDGREVIVKVRRPGIRAAIDRDMRLLVAVLRVLEKWIPAIRSYDPESLAREIWARMQIETDLHREALNVRRFVEGLRERPEAWVPDVVEELCTESILVQEFSHGCRIDDPKLAPQGPRLAQALVALYVHQFFVMGVFHGDPHPGNLFVLADGRLCFHDFGVVGELSRTMRRQLAVFLLALADQDEDWLIDAATDLGLLSPTVDRGLAHQRVSAVLAEYASRPLSDWSLGDVLVRLMRLGRASGIAIHTRLAILARAGLLIEQVLRGLDRNITVVGALAHAAPGVMERLLASEPEQSALLRLESETSSVVQRLPGLAAHWLRYVRGEGGRAPVSLHVGSSNGIPRPPEPNVDRVALALVTLGIYVASALLALSGGGPRALGGIPILAAIGFALALWLTLRIGRGITAAERRSGWTEG